MVDLNIHWLIQCEMDALAETLTKDAINNMNLSVVGLYHSHNSFSPNPSLFDIEHQTKNQNLFQNANGDEPFISIIVCPYDQKHPSHCSQFNFVHICKEWTPDFNNSLFFLPFKSKVDKSNLHKKRTSLLTSPRSRVYYWRTKIGKHGRYTSYKFSA